MTVRHIVVFRWKDSTSAADVAVIDAAVAALPSKVPSLRSYRHGSDLGLGEGRWDYGIVAEFDDVPGWAAYDTNADHHRVRADVIGPHIAERAAIQIETAD